jgi:serine/threonine protein kinase
MSADPTLTVALFPPGGPPATDEPTPLPGYELIEEIGRGGMGIVYQARQKSLNRIVALKMVLAGGRASAAELDRFKAEAEAVGRLQHANIVQVYEVNEHEGQPFFTLEYCPNGSLAKRLGGKPLPEKEAAELIEDLARAMTVVHAAGIVHRDLKPANVLMASDGTPKVTDFGIAKTQSNSSHTQTGAILGSPSYMAPEQAEGLSKEVGPEADVWALGAILYECLTGRPPFVAATPVETMRQVIDEDPLPPRMLNRALDPDLEKIVLKCLEKEPELRYRSGAELAEDLRRYREGEPIQARSINLLERLQREIGRSQHDAKLRPWGTGLVILGLLIFAAQSVTSCLLVADLPETPSFWIPRGVFLALLVVWLKRYGFGNGFFPTSPVERMLWAIWLGYLLAFSSVFWIVKAEGKGHLDMYPAAFALSGLAWFATAGCVWGGAYVIGLLFLIAAPLMTRMEGSPWAPAVFGLAWGLTLLAVGLRYRRLG